MEDVRIQRLADLITGYSLGVRSGDMVRLDGGAVAFPLVVALYRSVLKRGAHAYPHIAVDGLAEILLEEGSDEQVEWVSPLERNEIDLVDALVTIWGDVNTRALSGVDPARRGRQLATRRELRERRFARIEAGELRWVGTLFPTNAHAQDAGMSLGEYERFVYRACHCEDGEDAAAHWQATAAGLEAVARSFEAVRELRVVGPDTDLTLGVAGRPWVAADGHLNMPDGEIFTSPVETETRGEIRFQFPAIYEGREVEDVRLRFEGGEVTQAEAARGGDYLEALLAMEGARVLGEVAFGLNYEIDRFTHNILFDEKIGGTMHFALGSGFQITGGKNRSGLHWDMICDLRAEGEVFADGELVWKAGRFLEAA
jgi:aminopeptidase